MSSLIDSGFSCTISMKSLTFSIGRVGRRPAKQTSQTHKIKTHTLVFEHRNNSTVVLGCKPFVERGNSHDLVYFERKRRKLGNDSGESAKLGEVFVYVQAVKSALNSYKVSR